MVDFGKEEAKELEENIDKRIKKAHRIMDFALCIPGSGNWTIGPKTFKELLYIILGSEHIRRDLRRYFKDNGYYQEEDN